MRLVGGSQASSNKVISGLTHLHIEASLPQESASNLAMANPLGLSHQILFVDVGKRELLT